MPERVYGMHHIGITVPDINEGIAFFKAVFGAVEVFRTGPFDVDEAFMQRRDLFAGLHTVYACEGLQCGTVGFDHVVAQGVAQALCR